MRAKQARRGAKQAADERSLVIYFATACAEMRAA